MLMVSFLSINQPSEILVHVGLSGAEKGKRIYQNITKKLHRYVTVSDWEKRPSVLHLGKKRVKQVTEISP